MNQSIVGHKHGKINNLCSLSKKKKNVHTYIHTYIDFDVFKDLFYYFIKYLI
jgi:hypothetical protein